MSGDMDETRARQILGDTVGPDNSLYNLGRYISWDGVRLVLDCEFDADEIAAIAWWVNNMEVKT